MGQKWWVRHCALFCMSGVLGILSLSSEEPVAGGTSKITPLGYTLEVNSGLWASWQQDAELLPQLYTQGLFGLNVGDPWRLEGSLGLLCVSPSTVSSVWYRYRGFFATHLSVGLSYLVRRRGLWLFSVGLRGGMALAQYYYADSYFFFPFIEGKGEFFRIPLGDRWEGSLGIQVPYLFRRDIQNTGLGLLFVLRWYPPPEKGAASFARGKYRFSGQG
ncbi:MAG: hypothetical protein N2Z76_07565 [Treponemataceae bacterium]|nr:hypothetical protein [Treponemataceae bacterium]